MDKRNRISVVINTYNAEQHLAAVLESVKDFDEVLICDMESTDTTLDIARQYGCRIITFERKQYNIVEPAREYAIHEAKHEWVFINASAKTTAQTGYSFPARTISWDDT